MKGGARGLSILERSAEGSVWEAPGVDGVEVGVLAAFKAALYAAKNCGLMLLYYKISNNPLESDH
jgi:hypothetical protein